tara:strand:+ start:225 stop:419 length:195 start_codon:yes stop_codon:yes gene_type:complete
MNKIKRLFAFLVLYSSASIIVFCIVTINKCNSVGWGDLLLFSHLITGVVIIAALICTWCVGVLL